MDYQTNFARLPEASSLKDHEDVLQYAELLRQITAVGADAVAFDHSNLLRRYTLYVEERWGNYGPDQRGGVFGMFQKSPQGVAKEILRPLDAAANNLQAAQLAAAKFPHVFYKWLDPIINPHPSRGGSGGHGFDDRFPSRGRVGGGF